MTTTGPNSIRARLARLLGTGRRVDESDGLLLDRYVEEGDPAAFEAILHRHGPMVWRVARGLLRDAADADDAFQAAFLVLVRKARSIRRRGSLASWLHGVVVRLGRKSLDRDGRRKFHETRRAEMNAASSIHPTDVLADETLHGELASLPESWREPILLHHLQGLTKEETARRLGLDEGTVSSRLARGRERLRQRLLRRGVTASAIAMAFPTDALPAPPSTVFDAALRFAIDPEAIPEAVRAQADGLAADLAREQVRSVVAFTAPTFGLVVGMGLWILSSGVPEAPFPPADAVAEPYVERAPREFFRLDEAWQARCVAFEPDGHRLLVGCADGTIRFFSPTDYELVDQWTGHERKEVTQLAFSANGKFLASGDRSGIVLVWNREIRRSIRRLDSGNFAITAIALSPDGRQLAFATSREIWTWNVEEGARVHELDKGDAGNGTGAGALAYSPDGRWLAVSGGQHDTFTYLFDVATGKRLMAEPGMELFAKGTFTIWIDGGQSFSPDGRWLTGMDNRRWKIPEGRLVRGEFGTALGHAAFSPDRRLHAVASDSIVVRETATGATRLAWKLDEDEMANRLAIDPSGRLLAASLESGAVVIWNLGDLVEARPGVTSPRRRENDEHRENE